MDQVNLWKTAFKKFDGVWSALGEPYLFKFFIGCLAQILLDPFLNALTQIAFIFKLNMPFYFSPKSQSFIFTKLPRIS